MGTEAKAFNLRAPGLAWEVLGWIKKKKKEIGERRKKKVKEYQ